MLSGQVLIDLTWLCRILSAMFRWTLLYLAHVEKNIFPFFSLPGLHGGQKYLAGQSGQLVSSKISGISELVK